MGSKRVSSDHRSRDATLFYGEFSFQLKTKEIIEDMEVHPPLELGKVVPNPEQVTPTFREP